MKTVQLVGHAQAQADIFTGAVREITVDTTNKELRVHDGTTAGGQRLINLETMLQLFVQQANAIINVDTINEKTINEGVTIESVLIKSGLVDGVDVNALGTEFIAHATNVSNPHSVTKAQVGLGNVTNDAQVKRSETTAFTISLLDDADAATARATLGVGSLGQQDASAVNITGGAIAGVTDFTSIDGTPIFRFSDDGTAMGPAIILDRVSVSPDSADIIGGFVFTGKNFLAASKTFAAIAAVIDSVSSGTESGHLSFQAIHAGAVTESAQIGQGIAVGAATDGMKGTGTVNAVDYFKNGVSITSGAVIQTKITTFNTYKNCTTLVPDDDSIPQITEGDEILRLDFTPLKADSTLIITVNVPALNSTTSYAALCLFKVGTSNAIDAKQFGSNTAAYPKVVSLLHSEVAGSTTVRTYTVRVGQDTGSVYINGTNSSRRLGGVSKAVLMIQEISA